METRRGRTSVRIRLLLPLLACVVVFSAPALAADCQPQVRDGWIRLGPAGMPMMAGFARIENRCDAAVTITGAGSAAFDSAQLHETRVVDGINRMRHLPELRIAPGGVAVFEPGGKHLMLMRPHTPLAVGDKVVVSFGLSNGDVMQGEFEVRRPGAL